MPKDRLTLAEAARDVGVSAPTLKRWAESGVIPEMKDGQGGWGRAAVSHARIVHRLRERGHSLKSIREAGAQGLLAYGFVEDAFPAKQGPHSLKDAAKAAGVEASLIERFWSACGLPPAALESLTDEDLKAFEYVASVLASGFPLVAFLQLSRVYGQTLAQIADSEVRLFHIYVHEPLMREGAPGLQMAEEMETLAGDLLPLASPIMDYVHQRFLQHYVEQDVVGHMEIEMDGDDLGRVRVAIAFCDLAGYTRFTEEEGEEEALSFVERFVEGVQATLPESARVVKTIGDAVMLVGQDLGALVDWAVGFNELFDERPEPRIGIHHGPTLYRDGDYFGREVNMASRVVARARGGEVLVTDHVVDQLRGSSEHLAFEGIGTVKLKGFDEPRTLCRAVSSHED